MSEGRVYDWVRRAHPTTVRLVAPDGTPTSIPVPDKGRKWQPVMQSVRQLRWQRIEALDRSGNVLNMASAEELGWFNGLQPHPQDHQLPHDDASSGAQLALQDVVSAQKLVLDAHLRATEGMQRVLMALVTSSVDRTAALERSVQRLAGALERQSLRHAEELGQLRVQDDDADDKPSQLMDLATNVLQLAVAGATGTDDASPGE